MLSKREFNRIKDPIYRVIDANFNRVREGLRVCEEFARFVSNDKDLTEDFKRTRNRVSKLHNNLLNDKRFLFLARDVARDVGRKGFRFERERSKSLDVFWANLHRSKEGLRVLEEFTKLLDSNISDDFRRLRYKLYELEKKAFKKLQALLSSR